MATIKSYTDLEQSKKLVEFLPIESADMHSEAVDDEGNIVFIVVNGLGDKTKSNYGSPVWSLTALLGILHDYTLQTNANGTVFVVCESKKPMISDAYDNPIDACYELILKLKELKML